ncbi:MAG TPA: Dabb family protein [Opitutaceae bacterium]|nr:Dabb family protein [Opitutaceae bacterium]
MKKLLLALALSTAAFCLPAARAADTAPKSVIHVVTIAWKADAKPEQIQAALDAVKDLPAKFPGITRVWTRSIKVQGGKKNALVMEFADEAALKKYAGSDAQKEWYKVYQPVREESTTFDITN